jgi:S1-C subfamily serine protease
VAAKNPKEKVKVTVWKNGKEKTLTVLLAKRPTVEVSSSDKLGGGEEWLGMQLLPSTSEEAKNIWENKDVEGVFVSEIKEGGQADKAGVVKNSLISLVQAGNRSMKIKNIEDVIKAKKEFKPPLVLLLSLPNGDVRVISIGES